MALKHRSATKRKQTNKSKQRNKRRPRKEHHTTHQKVPSTLIIIIIMPVDPSKGSVVKSVAVLPQASLSMAGHCIAHPHESAYGILLGRCDDNSGGDGAMVVTDALPVSHGTPSLPIAETALGLAELEAKKQQPSCSIVGWYMAPMLLEDTRPGPVALRLAANLATSSTTTVEPVLLLVQNKALGDCVSGADGSSSSAENLVQALGRDFGNQWLEKIATKVENPNAVGKAIQQARKQELTIGTDLLDHMADVSKAWYPNKVLSEFVKKIELS